MNLLNKILSAFGYVAVFGLHNEPFTVAYSQLLRGCVVRTYKSKHYRAVYKVKPYEGRLEEISWRLFGRGLEPENSGDIEAILEEIFEPADNLMPVYFDAISAGLYKITGEIQESDLVNDLEGGLAVAIILDGFVIYFDSIEDHFLQDKITNVKRLVKRV